MAGLPEVKTDMLCVVDIGNTNIVIGLMDDEGRLTFSGRVRPNRDKSVEEFVIEVKTLFDLYKVNTDRVKGAIISSVVPALTDVARSGIRDLMGTDPLVVDHGIKTGIRIAMDQPATVGSDLIVDAVGACEKYDGPLIIFDLGTATTCSVVDEDRTYLGTIIIPGVKTAQDALTQKAAQLPYISYKKPRHLLGRNTVESMQSGLIYGNAAMIDGLIDRVQEDLGRQATVIMTGGIGCVIAPFCRHKLVYEENLLLDGLWYIYQKNQKSRTAKSREKYAAYSAY